MARLFGLYYTSKSVQETYAKNTFPNALPLALLCWMHHRQIPHRFIDGSCTTKPGLTVDERPASEAIGGHDPFNVHYDFEREFTDFKRFQSVDASNQTKLDVVVSDPIFRDRQLCPIENKLTVLPDASTVGLSRDKWAPEMVLRPASLAAAAMSLFSRTDDVMREKLLSEIGRCDLANITDWGNPDTMALNLPKVRAFVRSVLSIYSKVQTPLLLQPLWATEGASMKLQEMSFDMLVWSDHAVLTLIYLASLEREGKAKTSDTFEKIGRPQRSLIRTAALFANLGWKNTFNYNSIYTNISFGGQTDKELSINGRKFLQCLPSHVFNDRRIPRTDIDSIIPRAGFDFISPERRLDTCLAMHDMARSIAS